MSHRLKNRLDALALALGLCLLAALGCEPQLKAHLQGAMRVGVSREKIVEAWEQCLPWIGYPRTLNAFSCLEGL